MFFFHFPDDGFDVLGLVVAVNVTKCDLKMFEFFFRMYHN